MFNRREYNKEYGKFYRKQNRDLILITQAEYREKNRILIRQAESEHYHMRMQDPEFHEKEKERNRKRRTEKYWNDPEFREKVKEAGRIYGKEYRLKRKQQK